MDLEKAAAMINFRLSSTSRTLIKSLILKGHANLKYTTLRFFAPSPPLLLSSPLRGASIHRQNAHKPNPLLRKRNPNPLHRRPHPHPHKILFRSSPSTTPHNYQPLLKRCLRNSHIHGPRLKPVPDSERTKSVREGSNGEDEQAVERRDSLR